MVYNVSGAFRLAMTRFASPEEFNTYRRGVVARVMPKAAIREGWYAPFLRRIKHLLLLDLLYPNNLRLLLSANRRLKKLDGPVFAMCSSPPFSLALVGALLKRFHPIHVRLAIDMRDPWTFHRSLGGFKVLKRWIESCTLRRADYLSTVSRGLKDEFKEAFSVEMRVFYNTAMNDSSSQFVEEIEWSSFSLFIVPERIKFVYTGSTPENYYDLQSFVHAAKMLREHRPELADKLQFIFVGACAELQREVKRQNINNHDFIFISHVSHRQARDIQARADVLLYLTYLGKGAVSTKIFEYFATGKPIFAVSVPQDSDIDYLLCRFAGSSHYLHTASEIYSAFQRVISDRGIECLPKGSSENPSQCLLIDYDLFTKEICYR